ncbi:MAG: type I 3-dehydroquinate dehydratase [Salibacteraceae bacterium]
MLSIDPNAQLCHVCNGPVTVPSAPSPNDWLEVQACHWPTPKQAVFHKFEDHQQLLLNLAHCFEAGQEAQGLSLLKLASCRYDLIQLPLALLSQEVVEAVPPFQRIISWQGKAQSLQELEHIFEAMTAFPARYYRLMLTPTCLKEALLPLQLLQRIQRKDVVAYAEGPRFRWTQLLALWKGSPFLFAAHTSSRSQHYCFTQLKNSFGWPDLPAINALYGVVGAELNQEIAVRLHNYGYRQGAIPALFLPFEVKDFQDFIYQIAYAPTLENLGIPLKGFSIRSPFFRKASSGTQLRVSANVLMDKMANLWLKNETSWSADMTDLDSLRQLFSEAPFLVGDRKAAIWGADRKAQRMAVELQKRGAKVHFVVDNPQKAQTQIGHLGLPCLAAKDFAAPQFEIVVRVSEASENSNPIPFDPEQLPMGALVIDLHQSPCTTALVAQCHRNSIRVIDGREVLAIETREHYHRMVGKELHPEVTRKLTTLHLAGTALPFE